MMGLGEASFKALKNEYFINYPEPQIILKLVTKKLIRSVAFYQHLMDGKNIKFIN